MINETLFSLCSMGLLQNRQSCREHEQLGLLLSSPLLQWTHVCATDIRETDSQVEHTGLTPQSSSQLSTNAILSRVPHFLSHYRYVRGYI